MLRNVVEETETVERTLTAVAKWWRLMALALLCCHGDTASVRCCFCGESDVSVQVIEATQC